jgi:preprotein translocase subunit SecA
MLGLGNENRDDVSFSNHMVQIKTGEGKSITLGVLSATLALLGVDVYCACYSQYLSKRDEADFKTLFCELEVENNINYGSLEQLCESVINERGNVRDTVLFQISKQGHINSKAQSQRLKVLLIDEVDVFFDKSFYGNAYCPAANHRSQNI